MLSFESSTMASVRSSRRRSRRPSRRSAYSRTRSGTSTFLPLTIVLTRHLPGAIAGLRRAWPMAGGSADGPGPSRRTWLTVRGRPRPPTRRPRRRLERGGARRQCRAGRHHVVDEERPSGPRRMPRRHGPQSEGPGHVGRRGRADRGRTGRPWPAPRSSERRRVAGRGARPRPGDEHGLVVAALALAVRVDRARARRRRRRPRPAPSGGRWRRPSGSARRRSPPYLSGGGARGPARANGAHHSSWRSGAGMSAGRPSSTPPGRSRRASRAGRHRAQIGGPRRSRHTAGNARSSTPAATRRDQAAPSRRDRMAHPWPRALTGRIHNRHAGGPRPRSPIRTRSPTCVPVASIVADRELQHAVRPRGRTARARSTAAEPRWTRPRPRATPSPAGVAGPRTRHRSGTA